MINKLAISFAIALGAIGFIACNEDPVVIEESTAACAAVKEFKFTEDDSVLVNLDSVFFSIDLIKGQIFNADSLPFGTKTNKLIPIITMLDGASLAELTVKREGKSDTTYNYLTNSTDTIDFTNPVNLRIVSPDGKVERNYTIRVNVHKMKTDSLSWDKVDQVELPSLFSKVDEQHSTRQGDKILCLTRSDKQYCLATLNTAIDQLGSTSGIGKWDMLTVDFGNILNPRIDTFTATDNALYILNENGEVYTSTDGGTTWTASNAKWDYIYGGYGDRLLGCQRDNNEWYLVELPGGRKGKVANDMPISGVSNSVSYSFEMSQQSQTYFVGGRKADGSLSGATWGYDGNSWAKISKRDIPESLEGMTIAPYYTFTTKYNWTVTKYPTIVAFGGRKSDGKLSSTVYVSNDYGYTWAKASDLMQLPDYVPAMYNAQTFVISSIIKADASRVSRPIEEWECPYIYMFGGVDENGKTCNTVWRGIINRLSFKPLQ